MPSERSRLLADRDVLDLLELGRSLACSSPLPGRSTARSSSRPTPIRNPASISTNCSPGQSRAGTTRPVDPRQRSTRHWPAPDPGASTPRSPPGVGLRAWAIPPSRRCATRRRCARRPPGRARRSQARLDEAGAIPAPADEPRQAHPACASAARARLRGAPALPRTRRRGPRRVARRPGTRGRGSAGGGDLADAPGAGSRAADASGRRAARGGGARRRAAGASALAQIPHRPGAAWNGRPAPAYVDGAASLVLLGGDGARARPPGRRVARRRVHRARAVVDRERRVSRSATSRRPRSAPQALLLAVPPVIGEPWTVGRPQPGAARDARPGARVGRSIPTTSISSASSCRRPCWRSTPRATSRRPTPTR